MAAGGAPPPGGGGGNLNTGLSITIDAATGNIILNNFAQAIGNVVQAYHQATQAANQNTGANNQNSSSWQTLAAQTYLAKSAFGEYVTAARESFVESTLLAARVEVLNTVLVVTSKNMGVTSSAALAQVQAVQSLGITQRDATKTVIQFERAQLQLTDSMKLARAAQDLAVIANVNSSEATTTLIEAILSQNVLMLRQFGIVRNSATIFERYAAQTGKAANALSAIEKRQAFLNAILEEGDKVAGAYSTSMEDAGKKLTSLDRIFEDASVSIGKNFVPLLNMLIDLVGTAAKYIGSLPGPFLQFVGAMTVGATVALQLAIAIRGATAVMALFGVTTTIATGGLTLVVGALAALVTGISLYVAAEQNRAKIAEGALNEDKGKVQRIKNLIEAYNLLEEREIALYELESGQKDIDRKQALPAASDAENRALQVAAQRREIQRDSNKLKTEAISLDAASVELQDRASTSGRDWNLNASIGVTMAKKEQEALEQINIIEQDRAKRVETIRKLKAEDEALSKGIALTTSTAVGAHMGMVVQARSVRGEHERIVTAITQQQKELDGVNARLETARDIVANMQLPDLDFKGFIAAIKNADQNIELMYERRRQGLKEDKGLLEAQKAEIASALKLFSTLRAGVTENLQAAVKAQMNAKKPEEVTTANALYAQVTADLALIIEREQKVVNLAEKENITRQDLLAINKETSALLGQDAGVITRNVRSEEEQKQMRVALAKQELDLTKQERKDRERILQFDLQRTKNLQTINKTEIQNVAAQQEAFELSKQAAKEQFELEKNNLNLSAANNYATRLKQIGIEEINFTRQRLDKEESMEIESDHKVLSALAHSTQDELNLRKRMYERDIYEYGLKNTAKSENDKIFLDGLRTLYRAYNADISKINLARAQQDAQREGDLIQNQRAALLNQIRPNLATPETLEESKRLAQQQVDNEMRLYDLREENLTAYNNDAEKYEIQREARRLALQTATDLEAFNNWLSYEREKEKTIEEAADRRGEADVASGRVLQDEMTRRLSLLKLHHEMNVLVRENVLSEKERLRIEKEISTEINRQAGYTALRNRVNLGNVVRQGPTGGDPKAAKEAIEDQVRAIDTANRMIAVQTELYQRHEITSQQLIERTDKLYNSTYRIGDVFAALGAGAWSAITPLMALQATLNLAGDAAIAAFDAWMNGGDILAAFRNAIADQLKLIAKKEAVHSLEELALGVGALAIGSPTAAVHFKSAALHAAAAAAAGAAGKYIGDNGGGAGGGKEKEDKVQQQREFEPLKTRTSIEEQQVRLTESLLVRGTEIARAGDKISDLAYNMKGIKVDPTALTEPLTDSLSQKLSALEAGTASRETVILLRSINGELVKANEKDYQIQVQNDVMIDGGDINQALDGRMVRSLRIHRHTVNQAVIDSTSDNYGRRELSDNLGNGGI
jgi:hypothetical protein